MQLTIRFDKILSFYYDIVQHHKSLIFLSVEGHASFTETEQAQRLHLFLSN